MFAFLLLSMMAVAQIAGSEGPSDPLEFQQIAAWVLAVLTVAYEIIVRFRPTAKSLSILTMIITILNFLVPDRKEKPYQITSVSAPPSVHSDAPAKTIVEYLQGK